MKRAENIYILILRYIRECCAIRNKLLGNICGSNMALCKLNLVTKMIKLNSILFMCFAAGIFYCRQYCV